VCVFFFFFFFFQNLEGILPLYEFVSNISCDLIQLCLLKAISYEMLKRNQSLRIYYQVILMKCSISTQHLPPLPFFFFDWHIMPTPSEF